MRIGKKTLVGAVVVGSCLGLLGASPASADSWKYPGGASCTRQAVLTYSESAGGTTIQHRAEGYSGYHYASTYADWYTISFGKVWNWYSVLSSRVGVIGNGTTSYGAIECQSG